MIVADASVIVCALLNNDPLASPCQDVLSTGGVTAVPSHWHIEALSAIRGLCLGGKIGGTDARRAITDIAHLVVREYQTRDLASRIWQLRNNLTTYDAAYVALAEALAAPLVTLDARIAAAQVATCEVTTIPSGTANPYLK